MSNRFLLACIIVIAGCKGSDERPEQFAFYEQSPLTADERQSLIHQVQSVLGQPYTWGGDTLKKGFDCSGLIQCGFRQLGFGQFRNDDEVHREITAHNLYHYNSEPVETLEQMKQGYFIFFDESGDGRITHNAVFDHVDEQGAVWVYDAYSVWQVVAYRQVDDFWAKGPLFGRPLKTTRR